MLLTVTNGSAQEFIKKDSVKAGDSTATTISFLGTFKYTFAFAQNTSATLTDSIKFYHIDELGNVSLLKFFKMSSPESGASSDSLQSVLVLLPTSNTDYFKATVLFDLPYVNQVKAVLVNATYNANRKSWVYWRVPQGEY